MDVETIFEEWTRGGHLNQGFGVADELRCAAMACQEEGISKESYITVAIAKGFNRSTANRCWSFVLSC